MTESSVKSAERALAVLMYLASKAQPVPAMSVARDCELPRSSTYHLLNVMMDKDFVTYYPSERKWGLGVAAFEIGSAYLRTGSLERLARPLLAELVASIDETAHVGVLHGNEVLYIAKQQPPSRPIRLITEAGVRLPAHLTAVGKAILMHLSEAQVRALFPAARPLVNRTGKGPQRQVDLLEELAACRERGYAAEDGHTTTSISCIAAPVFGADGHPTAAIGSSFWTPGYDQRGRQALAVEVRAVADELSSRLGWHAPSQMADAGARAS